MYFYENKVLDDNLTVIVIDMTRDLVKDVFEIDSMEEKNYFLNTYYTIVSYIWMKDYTL